MVIHHHLPVSSESHVTLLWVGHSWRAEPGHSWRAPKPIAQEALERIGALYEIEREIRGRPPDERRKVRHERARPLLDNLQTWLKQCLTKLSRKSEVAAAIHYALGRWTPLLRYCDDGGLEIDNNAAHAASGIRGVMPSPRLCRVSGVSPA
jgi:hypothetical protein